MNKTSKIIALALLSVLIACDPIGKDAEVSLSEINSESETDPSLLMNGSFCGSNSLTLWAGQTINSGTITVANDVSNLYITVYSTNGFQSVTENVKVWVGTDLLLLPKSQNGPNAGAPIAGQFPYKGTVAAGNEYTLTIPLVGLATYNSNECGNQSLFVVVHADVLASSNGSVSAETAWGGDISGTGPRWWYYSSYTPQCCVETPPTTGTMETAFAKFSRSGSYGTGYVFTTNKKSNPENYLSLNLTQNRWGWAGQVTRDGSYTFDLYAAAGLNNVSNGTKVGSFTVTKTGTNVNVAYTTTGTFKIQELHTYVGDFKPTVLAPGQYGYIQYFGEEPSSYVSSHSADFTVVDSNGDGIWIIAHAVAFGSY